ncbi:unnamed protein product [Closterium sp. Yama58-4]|nr:unnamed protein product [Closterium sp. Yama58-4]
MRMGSKKRRGEEGGGEREGEGSRELEEKEKAEGMEEEKQGEEGVGGGLRTGARADSTSAGGERGFWSRGNSSAAAAAAAVAKGATSEGWGPGGSYGRGGMRREGHSDGREREARRREGDGGQLGVRIGAEELAGVEMEEMRADGGGAAAGGVERNMQSLDRGGVNYAHAHSHAAAAAAGGASGNDNIALLVPAAPAAEDAPSAAGSPPAAQVPSVDLQVVTTERQVPLAEPQVPLSATDYSTVAPTPASGPLPFSHPPTRAQAGAQARAQPGMEARAEAGAQVRAQAGPSSRSEAAALSRPVSNAAPPRPPLPRAPGDLDRQGSAGRQTAGETQMGAMGGGGDQAMGLWVGRGRTAFRPNLDRVAEEEGRDGERDEGRDSGREERRGGREEGRVGWIDGGRDGGEKMLQGRSLEEGRGAEGGVVGGGRREGGGDGVRGERDSGGGVQWWKRREGRGVIGSEKGGEERGNAGGGGGGGEAKGGGGGGGGAGGGGAGGGSGSGGGGVGGGGDGGGVRGGGGGRASDMRGGGGSAGGAGSGGGGGGGGGGKRKEGHGGAEGSWKHALRDIAMRPERHGDVVLFADACVVVIRDKYPKARHHLLVIARTDGVDRIIDATAADLPLLRHMLTVGQLWAAHSVSPSSSSNPTLGSGNAPNPAPASRATPQQDSLPQKPPEKSPDAAPPEVSGAISGDRPAGDAGSEGGENVREKALPGKGGLVVPITRGPGPGVTTAGSSPPQPLRFRFGFHQVPSMHQLHLHAISQDLDSPHLKHKKHWNSFASPFFRDALQVISQIEQHGHVLPALPTTHIASSVAGQNLFPGSGETSPRAPPVAPEAGAGKGSGAAVAEGAAVAAAEALGGLAIAGDGEGRSGERLAGEESRKAVADADAAPRSRSRLGASDEVVGALEKEARHLLRHELRCHRCRSVQPNLPRLKTHIRTCSAPMPGSQVGLDSSGAAITFLCNPPLISTHKRINAEVYGLLCKLFDSLTTKCQRLPCSFNGLPPSRQYFGVTSVGHTIYVIGGQTIDNTGIMTDLTFSASADSYNPLTNTSRSLPSLKTPRSRFACCASSDVVFVIGGVTSGYEVLSSIEVFDLRQDCWLQASSLPAPRQGAHAQIIGNRLFVLGGCSSPLEDTDPNYTLFVCDAIKKGKKAVATEPEVPVQDPPYVVWMKSRQERGDRRARIRNENLETRGGEPFGDPDNHTCAEPETEPIESSESEPEEFWAYESSDSEADSDASIDTVDSDADQDVDNTELEGERPGESNANGKRKMKQKSLKPKKKRKILERDYKEICEDLAMSGGGNVARPGWFTFMDDIRAGTAAVTPHVVDGGGAAENHADPLRNPVPPTPAPVTPGTVAGPSGLTPAQKAEPSTPVRNKRAAESATLMGAKLIADTLKECNKEGLAKLEAITQLIMSAVASATVANNAAPADNNGPAVSDGAPAPEQPTGLESETTEGAAAAANSTGQQ